MAYYTVFNLTVDPENNDIIEDFRKNPNAEMALTAEGDPNEEAKWYNSDEDLINFSLKYPNHLFTLEGVGQENGDMWRLYCQNGKFKRLAVEIKWPDFDLSMLQ